jgi:hypothetical protein
MGEVASFLPWREFVITIGVTRGTFRKSRPDFAYFDLAAGAKSAIISLLEDDRMLENADGVIELLGVAADRVKVKISMKYEGKD